MSVTGTFHCCSSHFQKDVEESCGLVPFPIDFLLQVDLQSRKIILKKKNQSSSNLYYFKSFLLLFKLNFQLFSEYSASDSTYKALGSYCSG